MEGHKTVSFECPIPYRGQPCRGTVTVTGITTYPTTTLLKGKCGTCGKGTAIDILTTLLS